ncbi:MAG: sporulation initiation factor Spo0A C-terminal domain-containing protein [Ruminococcus flavefaciens]|nr:sporulation initiation factor Spo0A C-terminal domain-containing protein [Ruminococcus flavefaciens]
MTNNSKMLIESKSIIGTKIADRLSEKGIYAVAQPSFSTEEVENNNAILIDNTNGDMSESLETLILSGKSSVDTFVLTNNSEQMISDKNGVLFISQKIDTESICDIIHYCVKGGNLQKQIEKTIAKMLLYMGFQANHKGYRYTVESILLILDNPEFAYGFNYKLYPVIAKKHNVTPLSVERALRTAISSAYDRNYRKFEEFFEYKLQKPTNTEFVSFCTEQVRLKFF